MQQVEARRVKPVFVAPVQKPRSSYQVFELFFKLPNDTKLTHLNVFTFTFFTPVLHIYMKKLLDFAQLRVFFASRQ